MTPPVEIKLKAVATALERALPRGWEVREVARKADYRGNEALTVSLSDGVRQLQGRHEFDELPADIAKHYRDRISYA